MTDRAGERRGFLSKARAGAVVPVARVLPAHGLAPLPLFERMRGTGEECFLLESVEGGETLARYTFLGAAPVARLTVADGVAREERAGEERVLDEPFLLALARLATCEGFLPHADLPPLTAGAVGFFSYDAVRLFEAIPDRHPREGRIPDALFLLFEAVAAFDHARRRLLLMTNVEAPAAGEEEAEVDRAIARLDRLESFLAGPAAGSPSSATAAADFVPLVGREEFLDRVERAKEAILAGEVYQVVLSERWTAPLGVDPLEVYRALRTLNPSPYLFYLQTREAVLFGASPEMLVRCRGREVETRPIAGTIGRAAAEEEDRALEARLLADPKERAEHVMLVDLARNDLGRVCEIGSVQVPRYAAVEKYSHVQHIVSEVRGRLGAGKTAVDALAACFPAGTLTGAPKIRAMELIDELEEARRGVYGGAVGYLDRGGNLDFAIAIRAAVVEEGVCRIQAGAGIVADSVPEREYQEAESKAAALFRAIEMARGAANPKSEIRNPKSSP